MKSSIPVLAITTASLLMCGECLAEQPLGGQAQQVEEKKEYITFNKDHTIYGWLPDPAKLGAAVGDAALRGQNIMVVYRPLVVWLCDDTWIDPVLDKYKKALARAIMDSIMGGVEGAASYASIQIANFFAFHGKGELKRYLLRTSPDRYRDIDRLALEAERIPVNRIPDELLWQVVPLDISPALREELRGRLRALSGLTRPNRAELTWHTMSMVRALASEGRGVQSADLKAIRQAADWAESLGYDQLAEKLRGYLSGAALREIKVVRGKKITARLPQSLRIARGLDTLHPTDGSCPESNGPLPHKHDGDED